MADVSTSKYDSVAVAEAVSGAGGAPVGSKVENIVLAEGVTIALESEGTTEVESEGAFFVSKTITAANSYTKAIVPMPKSVSSGYMNISVAITGTMKVTLFRSFDRGVSWRTVDDYETSTETFLTDYERGVMYRLGIKTGDFTEGSAICRLGIGD